MKVTQIISGLGTGGAEMTLLKVLTLARDLDCDFEVVSLTTEGTLGPSIRALGIPVHALGMARGPSGAIALPRLVRLLAQRRPDVVQTWMYHADLLGGLCATLAGRTPVIWGIRHTQLEPRTTRMTTRAAGRTCAALARWLPRRILSCSEAGRRMHVALGYPPERTLVIPNGFDLDALRPNRELRQRYRAELGIPLEAPTVGLVARVDPQKDHPGFLAAAAAVLAQLPAAHFVLVGDGCLPDREPFASFLETVPKGHFHLLGRRTDSAPMNVMFDVACSSSSYGEGFSNAIGEAMACGIPCVVTDVGDSAEIVGDRRFVVPPRDPDALANALLGLLKLDTTSSARLSQSARARVEAKYRIEDVVARYVALYRDVARASDSGSSRRAS